MKFKTDENLPIEVAEDFQSAGLDALTVVDQNRAGRPDLRVAEVCKAEGRAVVTLDLDFSNVLAYPPGDFAGIVVLRPRTQTITNIRRLVAQVISVLPSEPLAGRLWIVEEGQIRIRSGAPQGTP